MNFALKMFKADDNIVISNNSGKANETVVKLFKNNKSKNLIYMLNIEVIEEPIFLIFNAKKTFNNLKQAFIKALIFWYFNLESHVWIKINASSYTINKILSQLNLNSNALSNDLSSNKSYFS